jgi:hypothetical protein
MDPCRTPEEHSISQDRAKMREGPEMRKSVVTAGIGIFLMSLIALPGIADQGKAEKELSNWIRKNPQGQQYERAEQQLGRIMGDAENEDIPPEILMNKVKEGASKKVAQETLVTALEHELERLRTARRILQSTGMEITSEKAYQNALKEMSLILLNGLSEEMVEALIREAQREGMGIEAALQAGKSLMIIASLEEIPDEKLMQLGSALLASDFPPKGYGSVASIFLKANVNKVRSGELIDQIIRIIKDGGGLIQLEREIGGRTRRN